MQDFRKLDVWQKGFRLGVDIYQITRGFPKEELYGLTSQLRRAAVSIAANIAEGCGRYSDAELVHFLDISMGSLSETDTFLEFARELGYLSPEDFAVLGSNLVDVRRMFISFIQKVRQPGKA